MDFGSIYEESFLIRAFEKKVEKEFEQGRMRGTTHGCIGQEIIPVLVMNVIDKEKDYVTGTHRCHGQVLAYTKDPYRLFCEIMGKADGYNCGMGGSQHIKTGKYITNGVTGGMAAVGVGMALSLKKRKKEGVVISFLGDGGFQEGYVGETMNMAGVYDVPVLYILENNHYAMSTPSASYTAGTVKRRVEAMDIKYYYADTRELEKLSDTIEEGYLFVKNNRKPAFIEINTFRLCGHSKSDDRAYMSEEEKEENLLSDPLKGLRCHIGEESAAEIERKLEAVVDEAFAQANENAEWGMEEYRKRTGDRKDSA